MSKVSLNENKTTYEQLERIYQGFRAPAYKIVINNEDIIKKGMAIDGVTVDLTTDENSDAATFSITNAYDLVKRDFLWTDSLIKLGNTIEISFGYVDKLEPLFFGYITNIDYKFSDSGPVIDIKCMDISFLMKRNSVSNVWNNMTLTDIVKDIAKKYSVTKTIIDIKDQVEVETIKDVESDFEFLNNHANAGGYEFFIVGKSLYFRDKKKKGKPLMLLEWGKHLITTNIKHKLADQVSDVIVRGVIEDTSEVVIVKGGNATKIGSNTTTGIDIMRKLGDFAEVIQENVTDEAEAQRIADARLEELAIKLVTVDGSCIGIPDLRAGRFIELGGLGSRLNEEYRIVSASHTIDSSGYLTSFTLEGNAV